MSDPRLKQLKQVFNEIDTSGDGKVTIDELEVFLTRKAGKPFNRDLLLEIFQKMNKDQDEYVSIHEFTEGYYSAETILKQNIDNLKQQLQQDTLKLQDTKRQLVEANAAPNKNESVLTVYIKSAEGLRLASNSAPIARVEFDGSSMQTKPCPPGDKVIWNETFTFYPKGQGQVVIEVFDSVGENPTELLGEVEVPLEMIDDQHLHEDTVQLQGRAKRTTGTIEIGLQWIYDKTAYFKTLIEEFEEVIEETKRDLEGFQQYYEQMQSPIKGETVSFEWMAKYPQLKQAEDVFSGKMDELASKYCKV